MRRRALLALVPAVLLAAGCTSSSSTSPSSTEAMSPDEVKSKASQAFDNAGAVHIDLESSGLPKGRDGVSRATGDGVVSADRPAFSGEISGVIQGSPAGVELIAIDDDGVRSRKLSPPTPKTCVFEYVYLARPDTTISGRGVHAARVEIGRRLAKEHPVEADLVIPVPESGTPSAIGYAEASGIPYGTGLVKNSYVGRTFIQPSQTIRQLGIRLKLNPLRDVIEGKRLVVVDDSIVRGNTQRALVRMLREAGAREVHVRISSPPVKWPCFYGIDFASRAELIANGLSTEEICRSIGADSLAYIDLDDLVEASTVPKDDLCRACFDGVYPVELPDEERLGKYLLEVPADAEGGGRTDADGVHVSVGGAGATDSLDRP